MVAVRLVLTLAVSLQLSSCMLCHLVVPGLKLHALHKMKSRKRREKHAEKRRGGAHVSPTGLLPSIMHHMMVDTTRTEEARVPWQQLGDEAAGVNAVQLQKLRAWPSMTISD